MKILKFKETVCEKDNLILLHKNCENCGAPLKLNEEDYIIALYKILNDLKEMKK